MNDCVDWNDLRERRMAEPGAAEAYEATRIAFELGQEVRHLREQHGWSQSQLARVAGMTQSAVARCEAGGTVRPCRCWNGWRGPSTCGWMSGSRRSPAPSDRAAWAPVGSVLAYAHPDLL
ncbi:helix-turn-helix domain-containing protein [Micromonospora krabiensis]|uniref:Helix-turn-helix domain-containing protein n=1 Tax=Micromonospora krabiensis TaxID=307121 RepID=A0A1C3N570_9ACTN|nr:helix-turn-helix transcriptional regulator [Micromonospora krabiensis]SBV27730.1 Helix-turn-helix domain-containing protein [Micromonospora krabiensis]